jgi:hypothetical protein
MAILSFGAMCRYIDVSRLKWKSINFESGSTSFEITFEIYEITLTRNLDKETKS